MTKQQSIILASISFLLIIVVLVFRPSIWQDQIEKSLNDQLAKNGWAINTNEFSGHLFTSLNTEDILLTHKDGASFNIKI